ncbi:metalloregulator ArsR/SmtB family transcription factor [Streptomyces sp. NPDC052109]|uniref:ArsR/SmtB family transcription factor n=1 Tax=Streptomyces sp. NPDC052109 TaxID=3155527 RepID=UPI00341ABCB2
MEDAARKAALYDAFARTGKALSSGKRLELLDLPAQGERTVDALAKAAGLNLTTTSAHLQTLKQAGLVATRGEGVRIHYRLAGDDLAALYALLRQLTQVHPHAVEPARTAYLGSAAGPAEEYTAGHIPGAISIPVDELAGRIAELPEEAEVVAYCLLAHDAVRLLHTRGRGAVRLVEGMLEWRPAELPVDTENAA